MMSVWEELRKLEHINGTQGCLSLSGSLLELRCWQPYLRGKTFTGCWKRLPYPPPPSLEVIHCVCRTFKSPNFSISLVASGGVKWCLTRVSLRARCVFTWRSSLFIKPPEAQCISCLYLIYQRQTSAQPHLWRHKQLPVHFPCCMTAREPCTGFVLSGWSFFPPAGSNQ